MTAKAEFRHFLHRIFPFIPDSRSIIDQAKETNANLQVIAREMNRISKQNDPLAELLAPKKR